MGTDLAPRGFAGLVRWHAPSLVAAGALAVGATVLAPPAVERLRAPPAEAPQARVVFGEALAVEGRAATLRQAPSGRVALFVGGIRQPDEAFRIVGRRIELVDPPASGEKVVVDYAY